MAFLVHRRLRAAAAVVAERVHQLSKKKKKEKQFLREKINWNSPVID